MVRPCPIHGDTEGPSSEKSEKYFGHSISAKDLTIKVSPKAAKVNASAHELRPRCTRYSSLYVRRRLLDMTGSRFHIRALADLTETGSGGTAECVVDRQLTVDWELHNSGYNVAPKDE